MFVASKSKPLATTITGSLPRPHWFTENLWGHDFLNAFNGDAVYREQYSDAVATLITDQTRAGLARPRPMALLAFVPCDYRAISTAFLRNP